MSLFNNNLFIHAQLDPISVQMQSHVSFPDASLPVAVGLGPFLTGLKRGEFRENLCVSVIFGSYQITP